MRELSHAVERSVILAQGAIEVDTLGLADSVTAPGKSNNDSWRQLTLAEVEKQVIRDRLNQHKDNSLLAADTLGLSKSAFYRHMKKHGLK